MQIKALCVSLLLTLGACGLGESPVGDTGTLDTAAQTSGTAKAAVQPNGTIITIEMYTMDPENSGSLQVFKPRLVNAKVGDTIRFVASEPTHQSSSIEGMIPEGAEPWEGAINEEVRYLITKPGVYGYKCLPHYAAGMVGLIVVKDPTIDNLESVADNGADTDAKGAATGISGNIEAAKSVYHPGLAGREFAELFAEAGL